MSRILGFRFVLAVQNLEISTRFYLDVLGFRRDPIEAAGWSFVSKDAFQLMLGECAAERPAGETGDHSWFARVEIDRLDEYYRETSSRDVEVLATPADKPWGAREFVIRTPDGHRIVFAESISSSSNRQDAHAM